MATRDIPDEVGAELKEYFQVSFNREDKLFNEYIKKSDGKCR